MIQCFYAFPCECPTNASHHLARRVGVSVQSDDEVEENGT